MEVATTSRVIREKEERGKDGEGLPTGDSPEMGKGEGGESRMWEHIGRNYLLQELD